MSRKNETRINEYDKTKEMCETFRNGFKKKLNEEGEGIQKNEPLQNTPQQVNTPKETDGDTLSPVKGDAVYDDEFKKLFDTVDNSIQITNFKIYPIDRNVIIEGSFRQGYDKGSGIQFKMDLRAGEIETSMTGIELNNDTTMLLQKLNGYYENWRNEWEGKLSNEYRPKNN